jgi:DeoR/GlpR family transcriptional regulator of sugar metabolism
MSSRDEHGFASQTVRTRRQDQISALLQRHGSLRVTALSTMLCVSPMTIRRDLEELEATGILQRVHGGAIQSTRADFTSRTVDRKSEKMRIARAIAATVSDGETLLLDIGTTVYYVAQELRSRRDLVVVTNSINAALELADTPNRVILVGGVLQVRAERSLTGPLAEHIIRQFRVDKLILGCGGIHIERGYAYYDIEETELRRVMTEVAKVVIVAADHSKFGKDLLVSLGPLEIATSIVTDRFPDREMEEALRSRGVQLIIAGNEPFA